MKTNREILNTIFTKLEKTNFSDEKYKDIILNLIFLNILKNYSFNQETSIVNSNEIELLHTILNDLDSKNNEDKLKYFQNRIIPFLRKGVNFNSNINLFYRNIHQTFEGLNDATIFANLIDIITTLDISSDSIKEVLLYLDNYGSRRAGFFTISSMEESIFNSIAELLIDNTSSKVADFKIDNSRFLNTIVTKINFSSLTSSYLVGFGENLYGIKQTIVEFALNNALDINIQWKSAIQEYSSFEYDELFDVIFVIPPFRGRVQNEDVSKDFPIVSRTYEAYYIQKALKCLNTKGKAAILVPNSLLTHINNSDLPLREMILPFTKLVVHFPTTLFKNTNVNTSLIMIDKSYNENKTLFADFSKENEKYHELFEILVKSINHNGTEDTLKEYLTLVEHSKLKENQCILDVNRYKSVEQFLDSTSKPKDIIESIISDQINISNLIKKLDEHIVTLDTKSSRKEHYNLNSISDIVVGRRPLSKDNIEVGEIPFFNISDITKSKSYLLNQSDTHISKEFAKVNQITIVPKGSVLLSIRGTIGTVAIADSDIAIGPTLVAFQIDTEKINSTYLYQWLHKRKKFFNTIATGSTIKSVSLQYLRDLEIELPSIEVQNKYANLHKTIDDARLKTINLLQNSDELSSSLFDIL